MRHMYHFKIYIKCAPSNILEFLYHCDDVVGEAMRTYKGNFIRRSGRVKDYIVSKAIDSEARKPAKLKVMV